MTHQNPLHSITGLKGSRWTTALPYLTLLSWVGILLLLRSGQQSFMAHDEGIYAHQARLIASTGDWVISDFSYDRTIGIQCLMALSFSLFGVSEGSARLPSFLASVIAMLLTYQIGCRLLNQRLAWLGCLILGVTPLWILYGRLATQDATLVAVELLGIWAILQVEKQGDRQPYWALLAGSTVGLGFLIKGFMIIPAVVAMLPYLIWQHRRYHHLTNPWLYVGVVLGAVPVAAWLVASTMRFGAMPIRNLFGKFFHLSGQTYLGAGPFYYLWNIPANAFPWALFALIGIVLVLRHSLYKSLVSTNQAHLLLVGYPVVLLLELNLFGTRTHYYPLQLLPFIALLTAVALNWLVSLFASTVKTWQWVPAALSVVFGALGSLMIVVGAAVLAGFGKQSQLSELGTEDVRYLALGVLVGGCVWVTLPVFWLLRHRVEQPLLVAQRWLACWLIGPWFVLATLNLTGVWGDFSPGLKSFLQQPQVATVLQSQTIDFLLPTTRMNSGGRKTHLLLKVYTPQRGQLLQQASELRASTYAWVGPNVVMDSAIQRSTIAEFKGWQLMQILETPSGSMRQSSSDGRSTVASSV